MGYCFRDMLNFDFYEKGQGIVSLLRFSCSVWLTDQMLPSRLEILGNMCIAGNMCVAIVF